MKFSTLYEKYLLLSYKLNVLSPPKMTVKPIRRSTVAALGLTLGLTSLTQRPQKGLNHLVINIPQEKKHEEPIIQ